MLSGCHLQTEKTWFQENPDKGTFTQWPLFGAVIPPQWVNATQRDATARDTDKLWAIDQLPARLKQTKEWLDTQYDIPHVMFWHCEAGCDRTGEYVPCRRGWSLPWPRMHTPHPTLFCACAGCQPPTT